MGNVTVKESGAIASFASPYVKDITSLKVNFSPVQEGSGEPSLDNIRPIKGWDGIHIERSGKNLIRPRTTTTTNGLTFTVANNGSVYVSGELTEATNTLFNCAFYTPPLNENDLFQTGVMIKYGGCADGNAATGQKYWDIYPWDVTVNTRPKKSSTSTENAVSCYYSTDVGEAYIPAGHKFRIDVRVFGNCPSGSANGLIFKPWIILYDDNEEPFEKPQREGIDISWSSGIGTVYGGTLDVITGELNVTWVKTKISELGSTKWYQRANNTIWYTGISNKKVSASNVISDLYKTDINKSNLSISGSSSNNNIYFSDNRYSTPDEFVTANGDVEFAYELETPLTYQLTPQQLQTFKGHNNIWSNVDSVEVEYELAETFDIQEAKRKIILNQPHVEIKSGDLLRFKTNMKAPLKECVVNFSPMQEGTGDPSPTNIRPIKGFDSIYLIRCGKNLIRPLTSATSGGITWTAMNDGSIHASGQKTSSAVIQRASYVNPGYYLGAGSMVNDFETDLMLKYGGCWNPSGKKYFDIYPWDITTNARPKKTSTSTENAISVYYESDVAKAYLPANHIFRIALRCNTMDVAFNDYVFHPWVYFDDEEDETFEKPMREEIDISFGNIGTIYGGTLNVLTGELTTDKVCVTFDGTESSWSQFASGDNTFFRWYYYDDSIYPIGGRGCSHFVNAGIYTTSTMTGYVAYTPTSTPNAGWINIRPDLSQISTLEQWKNFLAEQYANGTPVQCWFTKTNPITYQLAPQQILTLKGTNNIWSNANGSIDIKFWTH